MWVGRNSVDGIHWVNFKHYGKWFSWEYQVRGNGGKLIKWYYCGYTKWGSQIAILALAQAHFMGCVPEVLTVAHTDGCGGGTSETLVSGAAIAADISCWRSTGQSLGVPQGPKTIGRCSSAEV